MRLSPEQRIKELEEEVARLKGNNAEYFDFGEGIKISCITGLSNPLAIVDGLYNDKYKGTALYVAPCYEAELSKETGTQVIRLRKK